jgi:ribosome recycling factor
MTYQTIVKDTRDKMDKALHHLADQLKTIRTSRASPALVDHIRLDYYGTMSPLSQVAQISIPEPRQIMIKPFDPSILKELAKALLKADLGCAPKEDGKVLRLSLPPLSGEQRNKYAAKVKEMGEEARVSLRNSRRELNKLTDQMEKAGSLTMDENHKLHTDVQELLKVYEKKVDDLLDKKTAEIQEV